MGGWPLVLALENEPMGLEMSVRGAEIGSEGQEWMWAIKVDGLSSEVSWTHIEEASVSPQFTDTPGRGQYATIIVYR